MPKSTTLTSDAESIYSSDDETPTSSTKPHAMNPLPNEDESGFSGDEDSDEEPDEVVFVPQDEAVWTIDELEVLCPFKDEWLESSLDQRAAIIEKVVKEILAIQKQDPGPLRKKVRTWLTRKVKKRKTFGPGKAPPMHTVVAWYKDVELTKRVKEKHGVIPGDKGRFIGLWKTELTAMVNDLTCNPSKKKELKDMEAKRTRWTVKGPPRDKRKSAAEKKAMEMVKNFAYEIYWETGARIVVTIGYRNTKNTVCVGQFDWNKFLGKAGESFVENDEAEADAFLDKFREYAQEHLSGDEGDTLQDVSADKGRTKLSQLKPDLAFTRNSKQEALLPADCLTLKLEEKKHVFRCFLKSQYGLAKNAPYPGSRCTPPWARLSESPGRFFSSEDIPEVDYDDGRRKVTLQDPSRMKNQELNACLQLWQDRQKENKSSFQFHHWWSEGQREYIQAHEPQPFDTDEDDDVAETHKPGAHGNRKGKKRKVDKEKDPKTQTPRDPNTEAEDTTGQRSTRDVHEKKNKNRKDARKNKNKGPADTSRNIIGKSSKSIQDIVGEKDAVPALGLILTEESGEGMIPVNTLSANGPPEAPLAKLPPVPNPDHGIVTQQVPSLLIDPALSGFPTQGPNDHVPHGFHAMPYSMLPSSRTAQTMPGPSAPGSLAIPPSLPLHTATSGTEAVPAGSGEQLTIERLAHMISSLQARLTFHETKDKVGNQESNHLATKTITEEPIIGSENLISENRPRTWPDRATPPQTRRKANQMGEDAKLMTEAKEGDKYRNSKGTMHKKQARNRQHEHANGQGVDIDTDGKNQHPPKRGTKRKVDEAQMSNGSTKTAVKKGRRADSPENVIEQRKPVKPRPTRKCVRKAVADEDEHFRLKRTRRK